MASSAAIISPSSVDTTVDVVHVEACQHEGSVASASEVAEAVTLFLVNGDYKVVYGDVYIPREYVKLYGSDYLAAHVESIRLSDMSTQCPKVAQGLDLAACDLRVHAFVLCREGEMAEKSEEDDATTNSTQWMLPAAEFEGLWENLVYDEDMKSQVLAYTESALHFADLSVDPHVIGWNRVVLFHGPPGTGKTSLAKAAAHKLAIRLGDRFDQGMLIEINAHSLFSKWFSESGKLVMRMFDGIRELLEDGRVFVVVLIDEVESLTAARTSSMSGADPSDAIRVVNALLTQLDAIKRHPNVLVVATSNITGAIDLAFIDRADLKLHFGPPGLAARYRILASCVAELQRTGVVAGERKGPYGDGVVASSGAGGAGGSAELIHFRTLELSGFACNAGTRHSIALLDTARACEGLSGRTLRKLPFLAHAFYLKSRNVVSLMDFLDALCSAAQKELADRTHMEAK